MSLPTHAANAVAREVPPASSTETTASTMIKEVAPTGMRADHIFARQDSTLASPATTSAHLAPARPMVHFTEDRTLMEVDDPLATMQSLDPVATEMIAEIGVDDAQDRSQPTLPPRSLMATTTEHQPPAGGSGGDALGLLGPNTATDPAMHPQQPQQQQQHHHPGLAELRNALLQQHRRDQIRETESAAAAADAATNYPDGSRSAAAISMSSSLASPMSSNGKWSGQVGGERGGGGINTTAGRGSRTVLAVSPRPSPLARSVVMAGRLTETLGAAAAAANVGGGGGGGIRSGEGQHSTMPPSSGSGGVDNNGDSMDVDTDPVPAASSTTTRSGGIGTGTITTTTKANTTMSLADTVMSLSALAHRLSAVVPALPLEQLLPYQPALRGIAADIAAIAHRAVPISSSHSHSSFGGGYTSMTTVVAASRAGPMGTVAGWMSPAVPGTGWATPIESPAPTILTPLLVTLASGSSSAAMGGMPPPLPPLPGAHPAIRDFGVDTVRARRASVSGPGASGANDRGNEWLRDPRSWAPMGGTGTRGAGTAAGAAAAAAVARARSSTAEDSSRAASASPVLTRAAAAAASSIPHHLSQLPSSSTGSAAGLPQLPTRAKLRSRSSRPGSAVAAAGGGALGLAAGGRNADSAISEYDALEAAENARGPRFSSNFVDWDARSAARAGSAPPDLPTPGFSGHHPYQQSHGGGAVSAVSALARSAVSASHAAQDPAPATARPQAPTHAPVAAPAPPRRRNVDTTAATSARGIVWKDYEVEALKAAVAIYGQQWAKIHALHGPNGTLDRSLARFPSHIHLCNKAHWEMGRKKGAEQWPMPPREQWATEHVPRGKGALAGSKKRRRGKASVDNQDAVAVAVAPVVQQQHRRSSSFAEDTAAGGDGTEPDDDERSGMGGAAGAMRSSAAASDADLPPLSSVALRPRRSNASLHSGNSGDASTWDATGPEGATAGGSKNAARQHRSHRSHRRRQPQDGDDEGDEDQDDDMDDDDHEDNPDDDGDHDGGQEEDDDDDEFTISHGGKRRRRSRATAARPPLPLLPEAPLHQQFPPTSSAVRQRTVSLDHKTASAHYQHLSHRTQRPLPASNAAGFVLHLPQPTPARMSGNAVALPSSPLPLSSSAYGYPPESLVHGAGTVHLSSSALASTASSSLSSLPPSSSAYLVDHHHQHHHSRYSLSSSNMHHDDPSYAAPRSTLRNGPPLTMSAGGGSMPATGAPILLDSVLRWSAAEVAALERAVAEHGADYDLILDLHGPQGTRSRELARFPHSNFFAKKVESEVRSRRAKGLSDAEIGVFAQVQ